MTLTTILGLVAATGTTSSFIPQVYQVFKTKRTEDISLGMFLFFCTGTLLWIIWAFYKDAYPILISNVITIILAIYILVMKIKNTIRGE